MQGTALQYADLGIFTEENRRETVLSGKHQALQVGDQVVQTAAEGTAEKQFVKPVFDRVSNGKHGVGVVLFGGKAVQRNLRIHRPVV